MAESFSVNIPDFQENWVKQKTPPMFVVHGGTKIPRKVKEDNKDNAREVDVYVGSFKKDGNSYLVKPGKNICVHDIQTNKVIIVGPDGGDFKFEKGCGGFVQVNKNGKITVHVYQGKAYKLLKKYKKGQMKDAVPSSTEPEAKVTTVPLKDQAAGEIIDVEPKGQPPVASQPPAGP